MLPDTLLVLSQNERWQAALRAEAAALQRAITTTASVPEAIALLAGNAPGFSHVLIDGTSAPPNLGLVLQLIAEAAPDTPRLIVLGPQAPGATLGPHIEPPIITGGATGWLGEALARPQQPRPARLTADQIRPALLTADLDLRYQAIVHLEDRRPIGIEALARLHHPDGFTLPPADFVPQVEAAGDGWLLTQQVLARALADWGDHRLEELDLTLSLNVPLDVLVAPSLPEWLSTACQAAGVTPGRLILELTETQIVVNPAALHAPMQSLRRLGIGLAIDDIAPVTHDPQALLTLPFTTMKLDRHIVREAADCAGTRAFISRNIRDGQAAGMTIVAEGIEDATLWGHMRALGADYGQGFYIARPLPAAAVPLWLRDWQAKSASTG